MFGFSKKCISKKVGLQQLLFQRVQRLRDRMSQFKTLLCLLGCEFCVSMMNSSYLYIVKVINFLNELEVNEKSFSLKDEGLKYFIRDTFNVQKNRQKEELIQKRQVMKQSKCTYIINYGIKLRTKTRAEKEYESQRLCQ